MEEYVKVVYNEETGNNSCVGVVAIQDLCCK